MLREITRQLHKAAVLHWHSCVRPRVNGCRLEGTGTIQQTLGRPLGEKLGGATANQFVNTPKEAPLMTNIIAEPSPE